MTSSPPGPPCDLCEGAEPALMSLMNLADYSQVKIGAVCAAPFFEGLAANLRPAGAAEVPAPGPHDGPSGGPEGGEQPSPPDQSPATAPPPRDARGRYQTRPSPGGSPTSTTP